MHAVNFHFLLFVLTGPHAVKEDLSSFGAFLMLLKYRYRDRVEIPRTVIKLLHMYHPQDGYESYMKVYLFLTFFHYFVKEVHCLSLPKSFLNKLTDFHESWYGHYASLGHCSILHRMVLMVTMTTTMMVWDFRFLQLQVWRLQPSGI